MNLTEMREAIKKRYYSSIERCLKPLAGRGVSPDRISAGSLLLAFISSVFYALGIFFAGGIFLLLSGIMDTMDGTYARMTGRSTKFGALLDSTLDRYADFFIFLGILFYYRNGSMFYIAALALIGSITTSYVKARAESLGQTRTAGLVQRPERFILLAAGSLLNAPAVRQFPECEDCIFTGTIIVLALLTNITALQRLAAGKKDLP